MQILKQGLEMIHEIKSRVNHDLPGVFTSLQVAQHPCQVQLLDLQPAPANKKLDSDPPFVNE